MRTKTSKDVLSRGARNVVDAETLKAWIEGPVKRLLPHAAMLCGQSVPHAGGYAAIQKWSLGVPQAYEAAIACAGGNIRSPILARLMRSGGPEFFDSDRDGGPDVDAAWHAGFRLAGWRAGAICSGLRIGKVMETKRYSHGPPSTTWMRLRQRTPACCKRG